MQGGVGLTSYFEREALAHDALPGGSEVAVHQVLDVLASQFQVVSILAVGLVNAASHGFLGLEQHFFLHVGVLDNCMVLGELLEVVQVERRQFHFVIQI